MPASPLPTDLARRRWLLAAGSGLALAACGGGGDEPEAQDRWQTLDQRLAVSNHAAVNAGDGSVIVIGGSRGLFALSEAVDRFDPATRRFTRIGSMRAGRADCGALRLADGRILVAGGSSSSAAAPFAELIDERSGAVSEAGNLVLPRTRHATTLLADGRVLITGGSNRDSAEIWDPDTRRWRLLTARLSHRREHHSATLLTDGRVLLAGGFSLADPYVFAELFDPATERFTPLVGPGAARDERRYLHSAQRLSDGSVLLLGGDSQTGTQSPLASVLRIQPAAGSITELPPLPEAATLMSSLLLPDDAVLLLGGEGPAGPASTRHLVYSRQRLRPRAALPRGRVWHSANRLPDGRVLVVGGLDAAGNFVDDVSMYG